MPAKHLLPAQLSVAEESRLAQLNGTLLQLRHGPVCRAGDLLRLLQLPARAVSKQSANSPSSVLVRIDKQADQCLCRVQIH